MKHIRSMVERGLHHTSPEALFNRYFKLMEKAEKGKRVWDNETHEFVVVADTENVIVYQRAIDILLSMI